MPRSVKLAGMNGWIRRSKRLSGLVTRKKCFFTCQKSSQLCGAPSPNSLDEPLSSVLRSTRSSSTLHKAAIQMTLTMQEIDLLERLIQTRRRSLRGLIRSIWMKMRRRCYRSVALVLPTPKVRKLRAKSVRRNWRKRADSLNYRSSESLSRLG